MQNQRITHYRWIGFMGRKKSLSLPYLYKYVEKKLFFSLASAFLSMVARYPYLLFYANPR